MATQANLITTYNANPTLQKQYTLDQYLALFDFGQTPTTPTPTPTPTPVTPGIPNIINQNINQGGGGDGGTPPPTGPGLGYKGPGSTVSGNFNIDDIGEGTIDSDDLSFGLSLKEGLYGLQNLFSNLPTPFNLARKAYEFTKQKELEKKAQEEAIARDIARNMQEANRAGKTGGYQAGYDSGFMDGPSGAGTGNSPSDKGGSDSMGSFARGGRVRGSYFNGGIVSLRRR